LQKPEVSLSNIKSTAPPATSRVPFPEAEEAYISNLDDLE
jgi:hypothetical protein